MRMPKKKFFGFYSSKKHDCDTAMKMQVGYHLIVELKTKLELSNDALIRALMKRIVEECELTEVSNFFHKFGGEGGVTGVVLLEDLICLSIPGLSLIMLLWIYSYVVSQMRMLYVNKS